MILYKGTILDDYKQKDLLNSLREDCYSTIATGKGFTTQDVIKACDKLSKMVRAKKFDYLIKPLLNNLDIPYELFEGYISMFEEAALIKKCRVELGDDFENLKDLDEFNKREIFPLGILFHIAAGNVDALPAYSVIEGLLVGNVNILKLPSGDSGLSVKILWELIQIEPKLKDYIYVFDVPSTEVDTLKIFADIADCVVVWGGDVACSMARKMASITTKIVTWGHKLSFAYATLDASDEDMEGLSHHICFSNQVLCSSCQGIFVDTTSLDDLNKFAKRFFEIFKKVNKLHKAVPIGMRGKNAINIYSQSLEKTSKDKTIYFDDGVSIIVSNDDELQLSLMFRNIWIKALPRERIINKLKPHKNHLQTAGLLCTNEDKIDLSERLLLSGVVRITNGKDMSRFIVGETHDGTYALREYSRIVERIK